MELRRCMGCMELTQGPVCSHCGCPETEENDPHQLPVGTVLREQYLVGRVLGQGGFGITYMGWDKYLEMKVAIKEFYPGSLVSRDPGRGTEVFVYLPDERGHYEESRERFVREARALAKLRGLRSIVEVHSFFKENNTAYIVMEYISGQDLGRMVRLQGRLSPAQTFRLMEPVVLALEKVHAAGMVHRDISPDNILLHPMQGAKLLDFGAARQVESPDWDKDMDKSTEAIIKHGYAPLEQYRSRGSLGPWTDCYALCATIYYCIAGQVPPDALSRSMEEEEIDWSLLGDLPQWQIEALQKGLSIRAKDRFANMGQLYEALFREPNPEPEPEPEPEPKPREKTRGKKKKTGAWVAAALVLVILAGAAVVGIPRLKASGEPTEPLLQETLPEATAETTEPAPTGPAWQNNVLRDEPLDVLDLPRDQIETVTFLPNMDRVREDAVDVSRAGDRSVLMWHVDNDVFFAGDGGINGKYCCQKLFENCTALREVKFQGALHTQEATSFWRMFYGCMSLEKVDAEHLETGSAISMREMFCFQIVYPVEEGEAYIQPGQEPGRLETLDVSTWDTSRVEDMYAMFEGCCWLTELDVSGWDTSRVKNMSRMFIWCGELRELDVSTWDTSRVTEMREMFSDCWILERVPVENWDVSGVTDFHSLFRDCGSLTALDLTKWDTSAAEIMSCMFLNCNSLNQLELGEWETDSVKEYGGFISDGKLINGTHWSWLFNQ